MAALVAGGEGCQGRLLACMQMPISFYGLTVGAETLPWQPRGRGDVALRLFYVDFIMGLELLEGNLCREIRVAPNPFWLDVRSRASCSPNLNAPTNRLPGQNPRGRTRNKPKTSPRNLSRVTQLRQLFLPARNNPQRYTGIKQNKTRRLLAAFPSRRQRDWSCSAGLPPLSSSSFPPNTTHSVHAGAMASPVVVPKLANLIAGFGGGGGGGGGGSGGSGGGSTASSRSSSPTTATVVVSGRASPVLLAASSPPFDGGLVFAPPATGLPRVAMPSSSVGSPPRGFMRPFVPLVPRRASAMADLASPSPPRSSHPLTTAFSSNVSAAMARMPSSHPTLAALRRFSSGELQEAESHAEGFAELPGPRPRSSTVRWRDSTGDKLCSSIYFWPEEAPSRCRPDSADRATGVPRGAGAVDGLACRACAALLCILSPYPRSGVCARAYGRRDTAQARHAARV